MWKVFDNSYKNANLIFPTKQRSVGEIVRICKENSNILKVVIFGSSVTSACNPWSDIDVYFEFEKPVKNFPIFTVKDSLDKWDNFNVSDDLLREIEEKGVIVYER